MTISYTASVATCRYFGCFWKLLFRWKASIYKLIWPNMLLYLSCYTILSLTYRFALTPPQREIFEEISVFCEVYRDMIPVSFVLGFYVSIVVKRWWDQYSSIPWPDPLAVLISVHVSGSDVRSRLMRRTMMRYANLCLVMTFRLICPTIKKKYPTMRHLVEAGFLLTNEMDILVKMDAKTIHPKYWMPIVWAAAIAARARREKIIKDDLGFKSIVDELNRFRQGCLILFSYDWISIPLVYTQVVTLAVYSYFFATLMATQYLDPSKGYPNNSIDLFIPYFTILQFFFFMGWLLVAESLVNPFGENDDDIEVSWLVERNLQISYLIVDEIHEEHPKLLKDAYWDDIFPNEPPTLKHRQNEPYLGSTWEMQVSHSQPQVEKLGVRSRIYQNNQYTNRAAHSRISRMSHFEASSRRFHDKESTSILKSIKNRLFQAKFTMESAVPTDDVEMIWNRKPLQKINAGRSDAINNQHNFSSETELQDYQSQHLLKQLYQGTPPHSWHGFSTNVNPDSKGAKTENNQSGMPRNIQLSSRSTVPNDPSLGLRRADLLDNMARCSHYMPSTDIAPSTTLYTINEEKEQNATNTSETEE